MIFNKHSDREGGHAFLSPSKYYWIRYDECKIRNAFLNFTAAQRGTELHRLASERIMAGERYDYSDDTMSMFVNDAIDFGMESECMLVYSDNCFGTADAISFDDGVLRIHDLKTGVTPAHFEQLIVYAAIFCLEYDVSPYDIDIELRLYQDDDYLVHTPMPETVEDVMNKIIEFDPIIDDLKKELVVDEL